MVEEVKGRPARDFSLRMRLFLYRHPEVVDKLVRTWEVLVVRRPASSSAARRRSPLRRQAAAGGACFVSVFRVLESMTLSSTDGFLAEMPVPVPGWLEFLSSSERSIPYP